MQPPPDITGHDLVMAIVVSNILTGVFMGVVIMLWVKWEQGQAWKKWVESQRHESQRRYDDDGDPADDWKRGRREYDDDEE